MTDRSTQHASFTIDRELPHPVGRVFRAFADAAGKRSWFGSPDETDTVHELDFRVGGREHASGSFGDAGDYAFDAEYRDIVEDERIIYAYDMHIGGHRISVSLAAIELRPTPLGTHLTVTEHGIYLDGLDTMDDRRRGTEELLDQLARALDRDGAA